MNKIFLNSSTYDYKIHTNGEINKSPSMTVPDQSMTVDEILSMFSRGLSIDHLVKPINGFDDPSFEDLDPMNDPTFDILSAKILLDESQSRISNNVPIVESQAGTNLSETKLEDTL